MPPLADRKRLFDDCFLNDEFFFSLHHPVKRQGETKPDTRHGGLSHVGAMAFFFSYLLRNDICFRYIEFYGHFEDLFRLFVRREACNSQHVPFITYLCLSGMTIIIFPSPTWTAANLFETHM